MADSISTTKDFSPKQYIESHGCKVNKVVRVWSAGESDFSGCETYLFLDENDLPHTAVEYDDDLIIVPGWNWFNHLTAI